MESKYYNKYLKYRAKYLALKNTKKLQKGGVLFKAAPFSAEVFINKLKEITIFLSDKTESDPQVIINEIMVVWKELIHINTPDHPDQQANPSILQHYTNLHNLIDIFNAKYIGNLSKGYKELEEYEKKDTFPQGCLDAKITWFEQFLIKETNVFKPHINADNISNNERLLGIITNNITSIMCNDARIDTKDKYNVFMRKKNLLFRVLQNVNVKSAIDNDIIPEDFVINFFDILWEDHMHPDIKSILDCNDKINKLP